MNYKHLHYFYTVAQEGTISKAARKLHLAPQTVSHQLGLLEESLGTRLLVREGSHWQVTESGAVALSYAKDIFGLGKALKETLRGVEENQTLYLNVGVTDVVAKHVAYRLIEPALQLPQQVVLRCEEGSLSELGQRLNDHSLDVVLAHKPLVNEFEQKAENYLVHECPISFMAAESLLLDDSFPDCLQDMPFLLPSDHQHMSVVLERWFLEQGVSPKIVGRFDDSALLKAFARTGVGACCVPRLIEREVSKEYGVRCFGRIDTITERYYAVKVPRKFEHPAVEAICGVAAALSL